MKIVIIKIGIAILNLIYYLIKLFPINKNKVTLISRQTNQTPLDFEMLVEKLKKQKENVKIVILCRKIEDGIINKIKYCFHVLKQMYHIATSKVVILDSYCIPVCILKQKKKLVVIQIWHALGSLKKFGYSTLDKKDGRDSKLSKTMKMHYNYTYILSSSKISKKFFKEAFNAKDEQMKVMNLPRVDFLKSEKAKQEIEEKFYEIYPEINNKKENILYCPTKRKDGDIDFTKLVEQINLDKYNFIVKLHNGTEIVFTKHIAVQKNTHFTGMQLLHVADYIITDYSAIVYEAAITKKPIYLYAYDCEKYMENRGTYIDYSKEMPGPICREFNEIIKLIENKEHNKLKQQEFCEKYIENLEENATEKLTKFILKQMN